MTGSALALLLLSGLAGACQSSFGQILRAGVAAGGLGYLLARGRAAGCSISLEAGLPWGRALIALGCGWVLTEHGVLSGAPVWLTVGRTFLLIGALAGVVVSGCYRGSYSRGDRLVMAGVAVVAVLSLYRGWQAGPLALPLERWGGLVWGGQCGLAWLVVSRYLSAASTGEGRRLAWALWLAIALVAGVGAARIADAVHTSKAAVQAIREGRFAEARQRADEVRAANGRLGMGHLEPAALVARMLAAAGNASSPSTETRTAALLTIGDIAASSGAWEEAATAYGAAAARESEGLTPTDGPPPPDQTAARVRWGSALFEEGLREQGLGLLRAAAQAEPEHAEARLALAVALSRTGAWAEAAEEIRAAARASGLVPPPSAYHGHIISVDLDTLLPESLRPYLARVTAFEITRVLEQMGWRVSHPGMRVAGTELVAPVDVAAVSGGAVSGPDESIRVGADEVSAGIRGYNVAVLDPRSGTATRTGTFGTWIYQNDGQRFADFLAELPSGAIVVGAVREEVSNVLTAPARLELARLGVGAFPAVGESHAFIGVKGAKRGSAVQSVTSGSRTAVGVLAANVSEVVARDRGRLSEFLLQQAGLAPARVAVLVTGTDARTVLTVVSAP
ncbi:MAG: interleukin-like EMT inducer domain-containing protein [Candidatus Latescibacterota bacterium]